MKKLGLAVVMLWAFIVAGCGANRLVVSQNFGTTMPEIKKVGVILSDVSVQEVSVGGSKELMTVETAAAVPIVAKVAVESVTGLKLEGKLISSDDDVRKVTTPYNRIRQQELFMMLSDREGRPVSPEFAGLAAKADVDAFILFRSCENESSGGRKALKVATVLLGGFAGAESTYADIALVDRNGHLLYYNNSVSGNSLQKEGDVKDIFDGLLTRFREVRGKI